MNKKSNTMGKNIGIIIAIAIFGLFIANSLGDSSLDVRFKIIDAQTAQPIKDAVVSLHPSSSRNRPVDLIFTGEFGDGTFLNVKEGSYEVLVSAAGYSEAQIPIQANDKLQQILVRMVK